MQKIDFNKDWFFKTQGNDKMITVTLPHDAMIYEKRASSCLSGSAGGYFPGGVYEYTKSFDVSSKWKDKEIVLEVEAVYRKATIYLNDAEITTIIYGYSTAQINLTPYLVFGKTNTLKIIVDNHEVPNSRWYSGSGIYRPVWLYVMDPCHIDLNGIKIQTLSYHPAVINVTTSHIGGTATVIIFDPNGKQITEQSGDSVDITISDAKLWSDESAYLYTCKVELSEENELKDSREISFGIRKVEWTPNGLFVNGKETLLRGGCVHHDNGILGAATHDESEWRRIKIMKENGFNAIRSSHNPSSRAMLEACDYYGMYMVDETWDMWYRHKSKYDYATDFKNHYLEDIKSMVDKDYNHPSVIFYSIGNEIAEPVEEEGMKLAKEMISYLHKLDNSRAVTAGLNLMIIANAAQGKNMYNEEGGLNIDSTQAMGEIDSTMFNQMAQAVGSGMNNAANSDEADKATSPFLDILDVAGYNYASGRYPLEGEKHPNRIIFGSETLPPDIYHNWDMVKKYPYLIGDFMWTAWDYLGEAGIGAWSYHEDSKVFDKPYPWLLGGGGVIDILGNPDGEALYVKTVWKHNKNSEIAVRPVNKAKEKLVISTWRNTNAIPSWSWKNCEGKTAYVEVYSQAHEIELFLNGESIGKNEVVEYKCIFEVPYQKGTLEAVAYDQVGNRMETGMLESADGELHICICPEKKSVRTEELVYVNVSICGSNHVIESNADEKLTITVDGGELLGFGSANPRTEESYVTGSFTTYYGRALAVIRAGNEETIKISVSGESMKESVTLIECTNSTRKK